MASTEKHWDTIFSTALETQLGWYEKDFAKTFELLDEVPLKEGSRVFVPGAGVSGLIDLLVERGVEPVCNDISSEALAKLKSRLGKRAAACEWLCRDISLPLETEKVDLWIDRAVLHFLTDAKARQGYFDNLKNLLVPGGYVMLAEFSKEGAMQCAGLDVMQYDLEMFSVALGAEFRLIESFSYTYTMPSGNLRPYIYALYQRAA